MGLLRNMKGKFARRKVQTQEAEYVPSEEDTSLKRDDVDVHDKQQRERYVKACLEQMAVASKELETLGGEYNLVTSYLTDIEEIEALPPELKTQIADMAKTLVEIESSHKQKQERKLIMSEEQYLHMERISEYMPAGYDKLKKTEEYQVLVKRDLNRLEGEKQAYLFRKNELQNGQKNMKIHRSRKASLRLLTAVPRRRCSCTIRLLHTMRQTKQQDSLSTIREASMHSWRSFRQTRASAQMSLQRILPLKTTKNL